MRPNDIMISIDEDDTSGSDEVIVLNGKNIREEIDDVKNDDNLVMKLQVEVEQVDWMKKRAGDQLRNALKGSSGGVLSTPDRKEKERALNAISKYQKAKKDDTCDDLIELTSLTVDNPEVFNSEDWNKRFQSIASQDHYR